MELSGASAIVTGGASGLGRATAQALVDGGAHVVLVDLPGPRGEQAAAEL
ncbi:SDR family NAD(P)-dependent oxidoreductase, partial [Agromyces binzhouensis]